MILFFTIQAAEAATLPPEYRVDRRESRNLRKAIFSQYM